MSKEGCIATNYTHGHFRKGQWSSRRPVRGYTAAARWAALRDGGLWGHIGRQRVEFGFVQETLLKGGGRGASKAK